MLVYERMTHHPSTVPPELPVAEALRVLREEGVHSFPVVDKESKRLVGMVTEKELLYASPSPATSLSVHEINYLLAKMRVDTVMSADPVTVTEDTPIEEAARLMIDQNVGALPVMRGETLVGLITENDLFRTLTELFAAREEGIRLTLLVPRQHGEIAAVTQAVAELGGDVVSLGTFEGDDLSNRLLTVKVVGVTQEALVHKMQENGVKVVDARACQQALAC
ncbi:MAG: CBS domain-containing protein [Chloroflexi bacterium]|nr:CBS domain-containing protein [Chloroflexota bacterium]